VSPSLFFGLDGRPGHDHLRGVQKGYGQFCPVAKAAEIFATRWTR
jgi:hypothetical protein